MPTMSQTTNDIVIPSVVETIPPPTLQTKLHVQPEYISTLPTNLKSLATKQFDELVRIGEILYSPSIPEIVEDGGFRVSLSHTHTHTHTRIFLQ